MIKTRREQKAWWRREERTALDQLAREVERFLHGPPDDALPATAPITTVAERLLSMAGALDRLREIRQKLRR